MQCSLKSNRPRCLVYFGIRRVSYVTKNAQFYKRSLNEMFAWISLTIFFFWKSNLKYKTNCWWWECIFQRTFKSALSNIRCRRRCGSSLPKIKANSSKVVRFLRLVDYLKNAQSLKSQHILKFAEVWNFCNVLEFDIFVMFLAQRGFRLKSWGKIVLMANSIRDHRFIYYFVNRWFFSKIREFVRCS